MAAVFEKLPFYAMDNVVRNDTSYDPFTLVDDAGESAETEKQASAARTKASDEIDWLPQHLKDLVDQHRPKDDREYENWMWICHQGRESSPNEEECEKASDACPNLVVSIRAW
jgi:hypothetical protein